MQDVLRAVITSFSPKSKDSRAHPDSGVGGQIPPLCASSTPIKMGETGALPLYVDRIIARMTAFPCIIYQRLQMRLEGHFCAVYALADILRVSV